MARSCLTSRSAKSARISARPDCFVWVALKDPDAAELAALQEEFGLHELAIEDAQKGHQRPKIDEYGSSLFIVMHLIEQNGAELQTGEVAVFVGPQYVISARRDAQLGFTEVRRRCEQEPELLKHGPAYVLYALMDTVVDRYFPMLDALTEEIEEIEGRIFAGQTTRVQIEALYSLKRKLMTLDHATVPLLEVAGKLYGGRVPPICSGLQDYFRDVSDHLLRLKQSIDNLRDMVATAISVNLSLITIQENEVTKRLAAYAALVAVPTMVAGVYGMNFNNMPELQWRYGYPAAVASMVADRRLPGLSLQEGEMDVSADALCFSSARELAAQIRSRQVSAREVMTAFLSQIHRCNPRLNAIVARLDDESCLALADAADRRLDRKEPCGPLHGLPIAFKDLEAAVGFPCTEGLADLQGRDAGGRQRDRRAAAARRRHSDRQDQRAGIRHGLAHLQQGLRHHAQSVRSDARAPADRAAAPGRRSPSGMLPLADGGDLGGSLRNPANFNNIVALRPTGRPGADCADAVAAGRRDGERTDGAVGRRRGVDVERDGRSGCARSDVVSERSARVHPAAGARSRGVRIAWSLDLNGLPLDRRVRAVLEAQRHTFDDLGCIVDDACPDFGDVDDIFLTLRKWASWNTHGALLAEHRAQMKPEAIWDIESGATLTGADIAPRDHPPRRAARAHPQVPGEVRLPGVRGEPGAAVRRDARLAEGDRGRGDGATT